MVTLHVGFDDTDSPRGGCTTYIAALLVEKLLKLGATFRDYPNLIRLNPNVPWKTRGNGALCLRVACPKKTVSAIFETVAATVEDNSDLSYEGTDPGVVLFQGAEIPREVKAFARKAIQGIVRLEHALKLARRFRAKAMGFGERRGIIGSLAAIGEPLEGDHTYEIIAYRMPENFGSRRLIDQESVRRMNQALSSQTFNNVDPETGRILITPRGPDPILYGIRGETANAVASAHKMIQTLEPVERWLIFRTNHGTDAHLKRMKGISHIQPHQPVEVSGVVNSQPRLIPRRHRVFTIRDTTGEVDCAAYEPTGTLRKVARYLIVGDCVEVSGGVRPPSNKHPLTINLEKLRICRLAPKLERRNPTCYRCRKGMSSMGKGQGFRCSRCGLRIASSQKRVFEEKRRITEGLFITSPRSQRHLTKPQSRYGKEKETGPTPMIVQWHDP